MINMQLFQRNNKHILSLRTLYIVMIYEDILHWPEIRNFEEAINVRLAFRMWRNALYPINHENRAVLFISWAVYAKFNANMEIV